MTNSWKVVVVLLCFWAYGAACYLTGRRDERRLQQANRDRVHLEERDR